MFANALHRSINDHYSPLHHVSSSSTSEWPRYLHRLPNSLSQYAQSAAPPAIVPSKYGLISITFFTVCEAMYAPDVALESTAITTPPWYLNPSVVVPCAIWILVAVWSARNVIGCSPVLVQESTEKKKGRKCCTFSTVGSVNVFCCVVSGVNCVGGGRSASICLCVVL